MRSCSALFVAVIVGLTGCDQTVVAPPTDSFRNAAPPQIDFSPPSENSSSNDDESPTHSSSPPEEPDDSTDANESGSVSTQPAGNVEPEFYEIAASVASPGPMGRHVTTDARPAAQIAAARAKHPKLTTFQTTTPAPLPDGREPYQPLVDAPAEPAPDDLEPLTVPIDADLITGARFSDPAVANIVIASREETSRDQFQTRLWRFDLKSGELLSKALLPDQARLIDVSPDGTRALVRLTGGLEPTRRPASSQTRLDIWDLSKEAGQHLVGWKPGSTAADIVLDATFVGKELILTLANDGVLTLWDTAQHAALRGINTARKGPLVLTPGRQGAFIFRGSTFALFDANSLEFRGSLEVPRPTFANCSSAACSADGTKLAAVIQRPAQEILIWDLASGDCTNNFAAHFDVAGCPHFVSPGYLMVGGTLFDTRKRSADPVWLFTENGKNHNLSASLGKKHWIAFRPDLGDTVIQGLDVPSETLQPHLDGPAPLIDPLFRPGMNIAVTLSLEGLPQEADAFRDNLARALGRMCDDHGLTLNSDAGFVLDIRAADQKTGESIRFNGNDADGGQIVPAHEIALSFTLTDRGESTPLWTGAGRVPPVFVLDEARGLSLEENLVLTMWQSAPEKIGQILDEALPVHILKTPLTELVGQTRLWAGLDDIHLPNGTSTVTGGPGSNGSQASRLADLVLPVQKPSLAFTVAKAPLRDAAVSREGRLAVTSDDDYFRLWLPLPQRRTLRPLDAAKVRSSPTQVCLAPNGKDFLIGTANGQFYYADTSGDSIKLERESLGGAVTGLAVAGESTIVAGTDGGAVMAWTGRGGNKTRTLTEHPATVTDLAAVPNSQNIVAAWADGTALLLDTATGKTLRGFKLESGAIRDVSISDDAQYAAFATEKGVIVVSLAKEKEIARVKSTQLWSVAFRPRAKELAIGTADGCVYLWDLNAQKAVKRYNEAGGQVNEIIFSYNGQGFAAVVAGRNATPFWLIEGSGAEAE